MGRTGEMQNGHKYIEVNFKQTKRRPDLKSRPLGLCPDGLTWCMMALDESHGTWFKSQTSWVIEFKVTNMHVDLPITLMLDYDQNAQRRVKLCRQLHYCFQHNLRKTLLLLQQNYVCIHFSTKHGQQSSVIRWNTDTDNYDNMNDETRYQLRVTHSTDVQTWRRDFERTEQWRRTTGRRHHRILTSHQKTLTVNADQTGYMSASISEAYCMSLQTDNTLALLLCMFVSCNYTVECNQSIKNIHSSPSALCSSST